MTQLGLKAQRAQADQVVMLVPTVGTGAPKSEGDTMHLWKRVAAIYNETVPDALAFEASEDRYAYCLSRLGMSQAVDGDESCTQWAQWLTKHYERLLGLYHDQETTHD